MTLEIEDRDLAHDRGAAIIARLERLPLSSWQIRTRIVIGAATFFDAFDALSIAFILPAIAPLWHLNTFEIGLLISGGYFGQLIGALGGGYLAERYGRKPVILGSVFWLGIFSLACAFSPNYTTLLVLRMIQGLGLGAEVPVAATYISELARSETRGRFVLLFELIFPVGIIAAGFIGSWIVPHLGWEYLLAFGAIPALLSFAMSPFIPESPRWLATRGRWDEAERTTARIESSVQSALGRPLPPVVATGSTLGALPPSLSDLFGPRYRQRTIVVWIAWFATYFVGYGLITWLPSLYQRVFKLPLDVSFRYALITSVIGFFGSLACALLVDHVGRRIWFSASFIVSAIGLLTLWVIGAPTPERVLYLGTLSYIGIGSLSLGLYLYTSEIYPTRTRAIGIGAATAWLRIASIIAPFVVGSLIADAGIDSVFLVFGLVSGAAGVVVALFATETKKKILEEISP
jgi:putative MFS transporter